MQCVGVLDWVYGVRVVLFVGGGNNGGDVFYVGARLVWCGVRVIVLLVDLVWVHVDGLVVFDWVGG